MRMAATAAVTGSSERSGAADGIVGTAQLADRTTGAVTANVLFRLTLANIVARMGSGHWRSADAAGWAHHSVVGDQNV